MIYISDDGTVQHDKVLETLVDLREACDQMIKLLDQGDWTNLFLKAYVGSRNLLAISDEFGYQIGGS